MLMERDVTVNRGIPGLVEKAEGMSVCAYAHIKE